MDGDVEYLLEAIEGAFDVKFDPGEFDDHSRFEDLYKALRSRLGSTISHRCFTSIAFWRLRRAMVELLGVPKGSVTPSTAVESIIPALRRRRHWRALSEDAGLRLPGLEYSRGMRRAIFYPSLVLAVAILATRGQMLSPVWVLAACLAFPTTAYLLFFLLKPLAGSLPAGC